jgi:hypothetical protein
MKKIKVLVFAVFLGVFATFPVYSEIYSSVLGKTIDEETGVGVKDVEVGYSTMNYRSNLIKTDKNGEFKFEMVPPGNGSLVFFPPIPYACEKGYRSSPVSVEIGKNVYIIYKLKYAGILQVNCFEPATNKPLAGVEIFIRKASLNIQNKIIDIHSDINGKITINRIDPGKYDFTLEKEGFGMKVIKDVEIRSKEITTMRIPFNSQSPTRIIGKVKCLGTGNPLKDVSVGVCQNETTGSDSYTDENGNYTMLDLEPGKYDVIIIGLKKVNDEIEDVFIKKVVEVMLGQTLIVNFELDCSMDYEKREEVDK